MSWGQAHPLPYNSKIKERLIGRFSFGQSAWILAGLFLSYKMSQYVPRLGNDMLFSRIHYLLPLALCLFLCYTKQPATGLPIGKYILIIVNLRMRRRTYLYRKRNTVKGGDH